ncbi:hypothetical protein FHG87_000949 [Trinorchestia longiramus]|nr:hypothetical protein FHG87_000949 [Trinorchestia longiramus]
MSGVPTIEESSTSKAGICEVVEPISQSNNVLQSSNVPPPFEDGVASDLIRYIDESGSSSCTSSLLGDCERHIHDDTGSLSHLLEEIGPGQFSIDTLDDYASLSCGYGSLDTKSDPECDQKIVSPYPRKSKRFPKNVNTHLSVSTQNGNQSLERQRQLLKPCGELLMRRSLGSQEICIPSIHQGAPCISLPGSAKVSPRSKVNMCDDGSSKGSSFRSVHTSESSIKSSDNILDNSGASSEKFSIPFGSQRDVFHCSSPVMMPPQCSPPPIPLGESSYVTSAASSLSLVSSSSPFINGQKSCDSLDDPKPSPEQIDVQSETPDGSYPVSESVDSKNNLNKCVSKIDSNDGDKTTSSDVGFDEAAVMDSARNLSVPLADMDEFSESKDHTFDTLESNQGEVRGEKEVLPTTENDSEILPESHEKSEMSKNELHSNEVLDSPEYEINMTDSCRLGKIEPPSSDENSDVVPAERRRTDSCLSEIKYGKVQTQVMDNANDVLTDLSCEDPAEFLTASPTVLEDPNMSRVEVETQVITSCKEAEDDTTDCVPEKGSKDEKEPEKLKSGVSSDEVTDENGDSDQRKSDSGRRKARKSALKDTKSECGTLPKREAKVHFPQEIGRPDTTPPPFLTSTPAPSCKGGSDPSHRGSSEPPCEKGRDPFLGRSRSLALTRSAESLGRESEISFASSNASPCLSRIASPPYLVIPNVSGTPNKRRTPPPFITIPASIPGTPTTPSSPFFHHSLTPTTPSDSLTIPSTPTSPTTGNTVAPHHYISSLRVASMRGTADMGSALVARVAAFLRTQFKSLSNTPVKLPWCPKFHLCVSTFSCNVTPIPAPGSSLPKSGGVSIPGHAVLRNLTQKGVLKSRPGRVLVESDRCSCPRTALPFSIAYHWATAAHEYQLNSYSIVIVVTLRDFRGGSLFQHLCKEVLPKHILSKEAMTTIWNYLHKIDDKVLFLLVGWDELNEGDMGDLQDLAEGRLLPGCTVLITSRVGSTVPPPTASLNRVYRVTGMPMESTKEHIARYCSVMAKQDFSHKVCQVIAGDSEKYDGLAECPIMSLALALQFEDMSGRLPSRLTDLYFGLLKHMTRVNLLRRGEPMCYDVLPDKYIKLFQEFGKLSLESIKNRSCYFSLQELKTRCQHGQELVDMGLLLKLPSASKHTKKERYVPLHSCMVEFLAAFYLAGLVTTESQLQAELDALALKVNITAAGPPSVGGTSGVQVVQCLVGMLGRNAHIAINMLAQMAPLHPSSPSLLLRLLRESGRGQMNVIEVCKHVSNRDHVTIQSHSPDLDDWGRLLYSPDCSLETLEILLDLDADSRHLADRQDTFFTSLAFNESARNIKLTCVLGGNFGEAEVTRLVAYVRSVLTKKRLEGFELQVTSVLDFESCENSTEVDANKTVVEECDEVKENIVNVTEEKESAVLDADLGVKPAIENCDISDKVICDEGGICKSDVSTDRTNVSSVVQVRVKNKSEEEQSSKVVLRGRSVDRNSSGSSSKRRSAYDPATGDVEAGINELEHSVCELIAQVGSDIGHGLIEEESEEDMLSEGAVKKTDSVLDNSDVNNMHTKMYITKSTVRVPHRRTFEVLSPVVEMICDTLPDLTPSLNRLVLALELNAEQLTRVCSVLSSGAQVQTLHLPRLSCGPPGLVALSTLMAKGNIRAVNLAGSVSSGTPIDERTSNAGGSSPSPSSEEDPLKSRLSKKYVTDSHCQVSSVEADIRRTSSSTDDSENAKNSDSTKPLLRVSTLAPPKPAHSKVRSVDLGTSEVSRDIIDNSGEMYRRRSSQRPPSILYSPSPSLLAFWSFTDAEGNRRSVFNSLPRSFYQSLPRRARLNGCIAGEKRPTESSSVLIQKTSFPPPACSPELHDNGFHEVLQVLRSADCRVCQVDLSKCTLGAEDLVCLGETVRYTSCLTSLHMEGLSRMAEIIPVLIGLQSSTSLQLLDLSSPHLLLGDAALQVALAALGRCSPLRFLVLSGWTFQVENERSLAALAYFLSVTQVQHIELAGVRISVSAPDGPLARLGRQDDLLAALTESVPPLTNDTIAFLNMDHVEVNVNSGLVVRGAHLVPLLRSLPRLLDLSLAVTSPAVTQNEPPNPASHSSPLSNALNSPLSNTLLRHHSPHIPTGSTLPVSLLHDPLSLQSPGLQDTNTKTLFAMITSSFPSLKRLNMSGWNFSFENCTKVLQGCGRCLKTSGLREVVVSGVVVRGGRGASVGGEAEHLLLTTLISNLHHLAHLSVIGLSITTVQATAFGKALRDKLCSSSLLLDTRGLSYPAVVALRQAVVEGGKHEVIFMGGPGVTYHIKKIDKKEKLLGRWACMSADDR